MCLRECDIRNLLSNLCKDSVIFNDHDIKETCPPGSLIRTLTAVGSVDSGSSGISFTRSIFCCWINATLKSKTFIGGGQAQTHSLLPQKLWHGFGASHKCRQNLFSDNCRTEWKASKPPMTTKPWILNASNCSAT